MTIEAAIISFVVICFCFVVANLLLFPRNNRLERKIQKQQQELTETIHEYLESQTQSPDSKKEAALIDLHKKQLRQSYVLVAYVAALKQAFKSTDSQKIRQYLQLVAPLFSELCATYEKKNDVYMTCFVYVLGQMFRFGMEPDARLREFLFAQLHSKSFICQQNAFSAICGTQDVQWVVKAVLYMNRRFGTYNNTYITEGLYRFAGDTEELADCLWEVFENLNNNFRLAVLNYLRLTSERFGKEMLLLLEDAEADPELHYSAIRYLGRYPFADAKPLLIRLLEKSDGESWVYAVESARSLGEYPGEDTFQILKQSLFRPEWYVRLNASSSLEKLGIDYLKLSDIINSNDRFAREIAQYRLEKGGS